MSPQQVINPLRTRVIPVTPGRAMVLLLVAGVGVPINNGQDPLIEQRTQGDAAAPLKIYEISDFQCSFCKLFVEQVLPDIEREYIQTGKAQLVFVNLPLVDLHENAAAAHEFAMCAAQQDRFWPVHDLLFKHQEDWSGLSDPGPSFLTLADSAGLDREDLSRCLDTGSVRWLVQAEAEAVARQGIRSTPSFIVEGGVISGVHPIDVWRPLLDSLFVAKTEGREEGGNKGGRGRERAGEGGRGRQGLLGGAGEGHSDIV